MSIIFSFFPDKVFLLLKISSLDQCFSSFDMHLSHLETGDNADLSLQVERRAHAAFIMNSQVMPSQPTNHTLISKGLDPLKVPFLTTLCDVHSKGTGVRKHGTGPLLPGRSWTFPSELSSVRQAGWAE